MLRYINAEKFLQAQIKRCNNYPPLIGTCSMDNVTLESEIMNFPVADVAPVKHGEWEGRIHDRFYGTDEDGEPIYRDGVVYYCSECRYRSIIKTNFCPNCGAIMDGKDEKNDS